MMRVIYEHALVYFGRDFVDLLVSPASKVLNNWFEVVIQSFSFLSIFCDILAHHHPFEVGGDNLFF